MGNHIRETRIVDGAFCEEDDIVTGEGAAHLVANAPHSPLRPVTPHCVPKTFPCYKSNTTAGVVLILVP